QWPRADLGRPPTWDPGTSRTPVAEGGSGSATDLRSWHPQNTSGRGGFGSATELKSWHQQNTMWPRAAQGRSLSWYCAIGRAPVAECGTSRSLGWYCATDRAPCSG
ncbi:unnamed protein product, partial [Ixodes persulcatus]